MATAFVIWKPKRVPDQWVLGDLKVKLKGPRDLTQGVPLGEAFPKDAAFTKSSEFKKNAALIDSLLNIYSVVVGSQRLKEFLEARQVPEVEYLPVAIRDAHGKPIADRYYIIHPINHPECLDIPKCGKIRRSSFNKEDIADVQRLAIKESNVPANRQVFRPKHFTDVILVRRALAEAMTAKGFIGIRWQELSDFLL